MNYPSFVKYFPSFLSLVFCIHISTAQQHETISTIHYKVKVIDDLKNQNLDNSIKNRITAINKASQLIECRLQFNSKESVFYQVEKMALDTDPYYNMASIFIRGLYYTSTQDSVKILNKNFSGINFNILMPFNKESWKIMNETKQIGDFTCYKAESLNSNITAWFTNKIPVSYGPNGLTGLPGLILEATINRKLTFYASHIIIKDTSVKFIERPNSDKTIKEAEFLKMVGDKMADFFDKN
ncbi:GLPGLI family protein [Bizionia sp. M204]|uniref:GLPGLI family protein n=1 Tax=unclassified Bizionia TaxID=2626393 RepID=UPI002058DE26|nr:GLPGLI family protein [Bizionia sp. M204]UPS92486.1 GLPGLI family protein [Bizionia sp. M204]